jgi:hypothetical protein
MGERACVCVVVACLNYTLTQHGAAAHSLHRICAGAGGRGGPPPAPCWTPSLGAAAATAAAAGAPAAAGHSPVTIASQTPRTLPCTHDRECSPLPFASYGCVSIAAATSPVTVQLICGKWGGVVEEERRGVRREGAHPGPWISPDDAPL